MQSSSTAPWMSFRKNLRNGQIRVFESITPATSTLNVKLPTGYGKTFTMCGVYSILKQQGRVNRLLVVFPSVAQINQFKADGRIDLADALVDVPLQIDDVTYFGAHAIKHHRTNSAQVFVTTIQALCEKRGMDNCVELMQTGQWMVCVDEYHHYGMAKTWGKTVLALPRAFLLAMSATPYRPTEDSAFGPPDITVAYTDAKDERAVKPLRGHAYDYLIDAVLENGDIRSFTTTELINAAGGESPEQIEKMRVRRKMRWSPKYVSPLVATPIERMIRERQYHPGLQALIGAMCVSHAELVCRQITDMYPELKVDWVGTGENGRNDAANEAIVRKFCPAKDEDGKRPLPELDILVHVGIAGEGLDSIQVSEVVFLNNASLCNKRNQEAGRAARFLDGVTGHISFDSSCEYAQYVGSKIMYAMDEVPAKEILQDDPDEPNLDLPPELPEEPAIQIIDMKLIKIDSGDSQVQLFARVMQASNIDGRDINYDDIFKDPQHPDWKVVIDLYRVMRNSEAEKYNLESEIKQWQQATHEALAVVTARVVKMMVKNGARFERSLPGDIKKRINTVKKKKFGEIQPDIEICRKHFKWLKHLEQELIAKGLPSWLS